MYAFAQHLIDNRHRMVAASTPSGRQRLRHILHRLTTSEIKNGLQTRVPTKEKTAPQAPSGTQRRRATTMKGRVAGVAPTYMSGFPDVSRPLKRSHIHSSCRASAGRRVRTHYRFRFWELKRQLGGGKPPAPPSHSAIEHRDGTRAPRRPAVIPPPTLHTCPDAPRNTTTRRRSPASTRVHAQSTGARRHVRAPSARVTARACRRRAEGADRRAQAEAGAELERRRG